MYAVSQVSLVFSLLSPPQDEFDEALSYAEEAHDLARDALGNGSPSTLEAARSLAVTYEVMQDYAKALEYYEEVGGAARGFAHPRSSPHLIPLPSYLRRPAGNST